MTEFRSDEDGVTATVGGSVVEVRQRRGLVATALGSVRTVDPFDRAVFVGLVLLFAGLWRWWHLGLALSVAGGVLMALGLMAALRASPAAPAKDETEG